MFLPEDKCSACEKIDLVVESAHPFEDLSQLPNTFDTASRKFVWKYHDMFGYAMIPRAVDLRNAQEIPYLSLGRQRNSAGNSEKTRQRLDNTFP